MTSKNDEKTIAASEARALVEMDRVARANQGIQRIEEICKELRIQLVPVLTVRNGQMMHTVEVAALD